MLEFEKKPKKEFLFTESDFLYLSNLAADVAGIKLTESKRELVYGRLAKRLRLLNISSFKQYCSYLKQKDEDNKGEVTHFINAITTNVTSFFRENHHFEYLSNTLLPELIEKKKGVVKPRLRIWSAGCSTGKEPYSIAMVLRECIPDIDRWDVKILATDLDSNVLDTARRGVYAEERIKDLSIIRRQNWFYQGKEKNKGTVKVRDEIKQLVSFKALNLTGHWPMQGLFDFIFYRNVAIYFDKDTRIQVIDRMANQMMPEARLFVGHSESLFGLTTRFTAVGRTIHTRVS